MAQQDLLDDLIEISKGFQALKNPLGDVTDSLNDQVKGEKQWNPADYKERPKANVSRCLKCLYEKSSCNACIEACPVHAISIDDGAIEILDSCRKCGLCVAACPTEAISSPRLRPKKLYDSIAAAAAAYETAYVTCTRALKRFPRDNEVVIGCIGDVTPETWMAILSEYPNVSVFLPLDICTACKITTGEEALGDAIAVGEQWAGRGLGLEVEKRSLRCVKQREYERKEFVEGVKRSTGLAVSKMTPGVSKVTSVANKLREHSQQLSKLERTLNVACGQTSEKRRRVLLQGRQLMLSALQEKPKLAKNVSVDMPVCDQNLCTMCGQCIKLCPTRAIDLSGSGRLTLEPTYCVSCGLCAEVCLEHALEMKPRDGADLVVPDHEAEKKAADAAKAHAEAEKTKAEAKVQLNKMLDQVEKLADE